MRWRRTRNVRTLPADANRLFATHVGEWPFLTGAERDTVRERTEALLAEKRWEPARGFELTDAMCTVIAAQAALITMEIGLDVFRHVRSIVVHPTTITLSGQHSSGIAGVMSDGPQWLAGQAHDHRGPVLLAWDAVQRDSRHRGNARNVAIHEFAHKIDMLDGVIDGTPPGLDGPRLDRWIRVCTDELSSLRAGRVEPFLDTYAATNPGEFFAVATEAFFSRPADMAEQRPALYEIFRDFYGYDGAARRPVRDPAPTAGATGHHRPAKQDDAHHG